MFKISNNDNTKCWSTIWKKGTPKHGSWDCKFIHHSGILLANIYMKIVLTHILESQLSLLTIYTSGHILHKHTKTLIQQWSQRYILHRNPKLGTTYPSLI